jgi:hypothetical protein
VVVGSKEITSVDQLARLVLEELVDPDETKRTLSIGISSILKYEGSRAYQHFKEGRHLTALNRIVEDEAFRKVMQQAGFFIIAIDECDKISPTAARLIRVILTKTQLQGVTNIRFLLSGISPFFQQMIAEDQGLTRFIYETVNLGPMDHEAALDLLEEKFERLRSDTRRTGLYRPIKRSTRVA